MTEDFTTRLRVQLREAAVREERRGTLGRRVAFARGLPVRTAAGAFAATAAAGLVLVFAAFMVGSLRTRPAAPAGPRVIANVAVAEQIGGNAAAAFGSVWLSDTNRGEVVRVDARTRRPTARIRVGGEATLTAAGGSVWALTRPSDTLLRIDPRTDRVAARIPLGQTFANSGVIGAGSRVWAVGQNGAAAVDSAGGRVVARIRYSAAGFQVVDAFARGGELWMTTADGTVARYDARTGRRLGRLGWKTDARLFPFGDELIAVAQRSVALLDPVTGRARWRARIGGEVHASEVVRGRVFVAGTDAGGRERLWQLDARTGRALGTLAVPGFTVVGLVGVGGDVWLPTLGGRVVVVAP